MPFRNAQPSQALHFYILMLASQDGEQFFIKEGNYPSSYHLRRKALETATKSRQENHLTGLHSAAIVFFMKSFLKEMKSAPISTGDRTAALLMDVVPLIMNRLRAETFHHMPELSMSQLRTLIFLYRHEDASVSQVSDYVGLKLPSMSKTVNTLVVRKLVISRASSEDRRCVRLRLSSRGVNELIRARRLIEARLIQRLAALGPEQQAGVAAALDALRPLFAGEEASALALGKESI